MVMISKNNSENKIDAVMDQRMLRRRLLKTGALVAPIALTLHGGVPLAHADSSGSCILELMDIANNQSPGTRWDELQVPINDGQVAAINGDHAAVPELKDYPEGTELVPFDGSPEHWEFISSSSNRFGFSCIASVTNNQYTPS